MGIKKGDCQFRVELSVPGTWIEMYHAPSHSVKQDGKTGNITKKGDLVAISATSKAPTTTTILIARRG
jgi:hypothetical protein